MIKLKDGSEDFVTSVDTAPDHTDPETPEETQEETPEETPEEHEKRQLMSLLDYLTEVAGYPVMNVEIDVGDDSNKMYFVVNTGVEGLESSVVSVPRDELVARVTTQSGRRPEDLGPTKSQSAASYTLIDDPRAEKFAATALRILVNELRVNFIETGKGLSDADMSETVSTALGNAGTDLNVLYLPPVKMDPDGPRSFLTTMKVFPANQRATETLALFEFMAMAADSAECERLLYEAISRTAKMFSRLE